MAGTLTLEPDPIREAIDRLAFRTQASSTTPFGGYKQSGFGGHDKSVHAHDQYTELKTIWLQLSGG